MSSEIFLVDTTIWIHAFRRSSHPQTKRIQNFFRSLPTKVKLVTTGIVLAEFIQGLGREKKDLNLRQILERYEYLPLRKEIYLLAGELSRNLLAKGLKTPLSDCLLAATAITYGVTLVTDDLHFKRFNDLRLIFINKK